MNLSVDPKPGSTNAKILEVLADGEWHRVSDFRERYGLQKGPIAGALHRLKFYYGYIIETIEHDTYNEYRLVGRTRPVRAHPIPPLGERVVVAGLALVGNGKPEYEVLLRSEDGGEWKLRMGAKEAT